MIYLILAGLVLVAIIVINLAKAEPFPEDMQEEEDRLQLIQARFWEVRAAYRPRAAGDRHGDRGGDL